MSCRRKLRFLIKSMSPYSSQFPICIYMYCPPKLHFFIKKSPLKLHNLLHAVISVVTYATIFHKKCPLKLNVTLNIYFYVLSP